MDYLIHMVAREGRQSTGTSSELARYAQGENVRTLLLATYQPQGEPLEGFTPGERVAVKPIQRPHVLITNGHAHAHTSAAELGMFDAVSAPDSAGPPPLLEVLAESAAHCARCPRHEDCERDAHGLEVFDQFLNAIALHMLSARMQENAEQALVADDGSDDA